MKEFVPAALLDDTTPNHKSLADIVVVHPIVRFLGPANRLVFVLDTVNAVLVDWLANKLSVDAFRVYIPTRNVYENPPLLTFVE